jgi:hypothetical protein
MSGIYIRFTVPKSGKASAANINYITRQNASGADEHAINLHNLDELKGEDYRETTTNLKAFAEMRLNDEATRTKRCAGEARTHYRAILSFDRQENTVKAGELAKEWLKENFPDARACAITHQNTKNTHIHVWVDSRKIDDRKIHTDNKIFKNLDTSWAKLYAREYGEHYLKDHLSKKQETKEYKKAKHLGREDVTRPLRSLKNKASGLEKERDNYGFNKQTGIRNYQRDASIRFNASRGTEQDINRAVEAANKTTRESHDTIQQIERTRNEFRKLGCRSNDRINEQAGEERDAPKPKSDRTR